MTLDIQTINSYSQQLDGLIAEFDKIKKDDAIAFANLYTRFFPIFSFAMPRRETAVTLKKVGDSFEAIARQRGEEFAPPGKAFNDAIYTLATRVDAFAHTLEERANYLRTPASISNKKVTKETAPSTAHEPGISFMKTGGWLNTPKK